MSTRLLLAASLALLATGAGCVAGPDDAWEDDATVVADGGKADAELVGAPTHYPIILAHGWDASPSNRWGFYRVAEALRADGHTVIVAQVPPYASAEVRAHYLAQTVRDTIASTGADKVNLVAHSMGGLDARIVASPQGEGLGPEIASITTISTPHGGSAVADVVLAATFLVPDSLTDALAEMWGKTYSDLTADTAWKDSLRSISTAGARRIDATYEDSPDTRYQSYAGVATITGLTNHAAMAQCGRMLAGNGTSARVDLSLAPMAAIVNGLSFPPNDGMVAVVNAKHGAFRGCIPADHLGEVGQPRHDAPDGRTRFDHVAFYRTLAFDLARRGM